MPEMTPSPTPAAMVRGMFRNAPLAIMTPDNNPTMADTAAKGRAAGLKSPQTILLRVPVARPAMGPASPATRMVPTESR